MKINAICSSCRKHKYVPETRGYYCGEDNHNYEEYNSDKYICDEWLPSKPDMRTWIERETSKEEPHEH